MYTINVKIEQPIRTMPCITNQIGTMKIKTSIEPRCFSMILERFLERVATTVSLYSKNCDEADIIISTKDIPSVFTLVEYAIKQIYFYQNFDTCLNVNTLTGVKKGHSLDLQKISIIICIKGPNVSYFEYYSFFHVNPKHYYPIDLMITNKIFDQYPDLECNTVIEQHNLYLDVNSTCPENAREIIREIMVEIIPLIPRDNSDDFSEEFKEALNQMNTITKGRSIYTIVIRNLYNIHCAISNIFMEDSQIDKYISELGKLYLYTSVQRIDNSIYLYTCDTIDRAIQTYCINHMLIINRLNKKNEDFDNCSIIVRATMYKNMDVNSASNEITCEINGNVDEILMPLKNWIVSNFKWYEGRGKTPDEMFYTCCANYINNGKMTISIELYPGKYNTLELSKYTENILNDFCILKNLRKLFKLEEKIIRMQFNINTPILTESILIHYDMDCYDVFIDKDTAPDILERIVRIYENLKETENITINLYNVPDYVIEMINNSANEKKRVEIIM